MEQSLLLRWRLLATLCRSTLLFLVSVFSYESSAFAQSSNTANTKDFRFAVVSIHEVESGYDGPRGHGATPDGYSSSASIEWMIKYAFGQGNPMPLPDGDQTSVQNLPAWAGQKFMINARVDEKDISAWQQPDKNSQLLRSALQKILIERFHLVFHAQQVQRNGYELVLSRHEVTFKPSPPQHEPLAGYKFADGGVMQRSSRQDTAKAGMQHLSFLSASMADLATFMNLYSDRPIYDKTELNGRYDFTVNQTSENHQELPLDSFQIQQIGLDLKPGKGPGMNLIIDHIDKPTPN